ncbi:MAG: porin [Planctomycetota bacterium]
MRRVKVEAVESRVLGLALLMATAAGWAWAAPAYTLEDDQSKHTLEVYGTLQWRYDANFSDNPAPAEGFASGFQGERLRVGVRGDVLPGLGYEFEVDGAGGDLILVDGFVDFDLADGVRLRAGQFKQAFSREFDVSPHRITTTERSIVDRVFGLNRAEAVELRLSDSSAALRLTLSDGRRSQNTPIASVAETDYLLIVRGERAFGDTLRRFRDMTSWRGGEPAFMIGGALAYQQGGETFANISGRTPDRDLIAATADLSIELDGATLFFAAHYRRSDDASRTFDDLGLVAQGGLFVTNQVELYARYEGIFGDTGRGDGHEIHFATGGVNWYVFPESHVLRISFEVLTTIGGISNSPAAASARFALIESEDSQTAARVQAILVF